MINPAHRQSYLHFGLTVGVLALGLTACGDDKGSNPLLTAESFLSGFKPGDSRLLLREFKAQGRTYGYDLYSLAEIRIEKDTVIDGSPAKAFTISSSEFYPESTYAREERNFLVAHGDSLDLYREKGGSSSFQFGLLKRGAYDTARFSDKTTEWVFPMLADTRWFTRPDGSEGWSLEKEWIGKETLEFEGREYACDVFVLHSIVDAKSWLASVGLLKAEIEYEPTIFYDQEGDPVDTAQKTLERYELLKLNPTAAETAAAKAKYQSLSWEKMPFFAPMSFSIHQEPECGFPNRTVDSLTRDSLFYTDEDFYASKTVFRNNVPEALILKMNHLFDSLRIDSLSLLNVKFDPCPPQTLDCKSHDILRVRRDSVSEYSDTRRCVDYDTTYLSAFAEFEAAMHVLRNE